MLSNGYRIIQSGHPIIRSNKVRRGEIKQPARGCNKMIVRRTEDWARYLLSNLCIIVLYLASLMARWQRVLLIRIARAARESILINTTTLMPCWSIRRHWSRHLPIRKGQMDAVATLAGQGANKKTDSRKIPPSPFFSKVHLYGICQANKKIGIYPPKPTLFWFCILGVSVGTSMFPCVCFHGSLLSLSI